MRACSARCWRAVGCVRANRFRNASCPCPWQRLLERGFNQSREIARHVARRVGLRVEPRLLERKRATGAQSSLPAAEREQNVKHAFAARTGIRVPHSIALLDDVLTTGNTAAAAARALKDAGCGHIELWVCARVPRHAGPDW
jgi:predicted amidophosphoribosyltransferase